MRIDMPYIITLIFFLMISGSSLAEEEYTREELQEKISSFHRMEKGGLALLCSGIPLVCAGAVLFPVGLVNVVKTWEPSYMIMYNAGIYCIGFGIPLTVAGGVVNGIGRRKRKEYEGRLGLSLSFNGISIRYRF